MSASVVTRDASMRFLWTGSSNLMLFSSNPTPCQRCSALLYSESWILSIITLQTDAIRINSYVRKERPSCLCFYSGAFALEGWFISDLGDNFEFIKDVGPPKPNYRTFPSFEKLLRAKWRSLVTKHSPISHTFVKARLLSLYRCQRRLLTLYHPSSMNS